MDVLLSEYRALRKQRVTLKAKVAELESKVEHLESEWSRLRDSRWFYRQRVKALEHTLSVSIT
jgi:predicted nuclease with TOPRIM domain